MSSDVMIICKEDKSSFNEEIKIEDNNHKSKAFFIDEASMGRPWSNFGNWFVERYCGTPGITEQLNDITEHSYRKIDESDKVGILHKANSCKLHKDLDIKKLEDFIDEHIGKHISVENW